MPVYFWEKVEGCSPDMGGLSQGVQSEELTREGHMPKSLPLPSQDTL